MQEWIDLMDRFIRLFGSDNIECLLADRKFVADKWLVYLKKLHMEYHIRIPENVWVEKLAKGKRAKALNLFNNLKINECAFNSKIVRVNGELYYLSAFRIINKENIPELEMIVLFNKPDKSQALCKERWQMESAFEALKTSGFNIENTHRIHIETHHIRILERIICSNLLPLGEMNSS